MRARIDTAINQMKLKLKLGETDKSEETGKTEGGHDICACHLRACHLRGGRSLHPGTQGDNIEITSTFDLD